MRSRSWFPRLAIAAALMLAVALSWYASPLNTSAQTDPPAKPTGLSTLAGDTKVKLTWDPPADGSPSIISYQLWQLAQNSKLTADITRGNQFGYSVAVDGDTAVIGVYGDGVPDSLDTLVANAGSAYVFTRNTGTGVWSKAAMLTASVPTENDQFGISVAIDGVTVVVGAHQLDVSRSGAAYVFTRPSGGWATATETAKLTPGTAGAAGDRFGVSVAVRGGTVVVGAHQHDANAVTDSGAAYVFTKPESGGWVSTSTAAKLTASDSAASDQFGISVAVDGETDGDTVVVGASQGDSADAGGNSVTDSGAAYVYTKPGTGWADSSAETAKLTASDGAASDEFGISVAVDDDIVVVGASGDDGKGSVYVYTKPSGSAWADSRAETAKLIASDGASSDEFGISVAVDGVTVVVGAHLHDVAPLGGTAVADAGAAYVFTKPVGPWASTSTAAKLTASDRAANDEFGSSVAVDGDTVMVGAYSHDNGDSNTANSGAVYVFGSWTSIAGSSAAGTTAHLVTGLTNDTTYVFRLRGVNAIEASDPSDSVAGTPKAAFYAPARLLNFSATQTGEGEVELTWDAHRYPLSVTGYAFSHNDGSSWQAISGSDYGTVSHTVTGLGAGDYTFAVRAVNDAGMGASSDSQSIAVVDKSAAPDSFSAVAGDGQVWLGWRSPADFTISKYEYQQKEGNGAFGGWQEITGSRSGTTFHIVTGLTNGTSYTFRVRAFNAAGGSDSSGEQSATPATASSAPVKPEGFAASQTSVGQVELTWDPSSNPLTVTGYEFTQNNGSTWTTISGSDHSTVSHTLNNLNTGNHTFAIRAVNGPYVGDSSGAQSLTVVAKPAALTELTINDPEPGSGIESDIGDTQVRLKWNDPDNASITKYQLWQFPPTSIKLISSDRAKLDELGWSVAVDGDTLVIGALGADEPNNTGAAYVFTRDARGWTQSGKLTALVRRKDAGFGHAVAVHGDTIVVGAYEEDHPYPPNVDIGDVGAAYVFTKPANGWADMTQTARLIGSNTGDGDEFGSSVAVYGETIVVGAPERGPGGDGSAYIFTKPGDAWTDSEETTELRAASGGSRFGRSVAVYGDTVVVGEPEADGGAAYVFTKRAAIGVWDDWHETSAGDATAKLTASASGGGDYFGRAVAFDGETIVVGAPYDDDPDNSGSAYVFTKPASGGWVSTSTAAKLTASDRAEKDEFGYSVAVDGDTVVVGARQPSYQDGGVTIKRPGSAYLFTKPPTGWTDAAGTDKRTIYDRRGDDSFGNSVAVDGDTVLVGAVGDDSDKGSAYVFGTEAVWADIPGSGAATVAHIATRLPNGAEHTFRVRAVNAAGADAASNSVLATPKAAEAAPAAPATPSAEQTGVGQVELEWDEVTDATRLTITGFDYTQDGTNWPSIDGSDSATNSHTVTALSAGTTYTFAVRAKNSFDEGNSSGNAESVTLDDQAAAPTGFSAAAGDTQVSLSWTPGDSSITKYQLLQFEPNKLIDDNVLQDDNFGYSVAVDGDTAVIGVYHDNLPRASGISFKNAGSAYVFVRQPNSGGWRQVAHLTASDPADDDEFGYSVDVDGDTIVVGARQADHDPGVVGDTGAVYVFTKPDTGWADGNETAKLTAYSPVARDEFGISVAVDGETILVGAHQDDHNGTDAGAAYLFTRPYTGWADSPETTKLIPADGAPGDQFGISVAVDGNTAVIGANKDDDNGDDSGSAYVFTKVSGVWSQRAKLTASDGEAGDEFGISVAVDDDTAVIGANKDDDNGDDSGSAYVFTRPDTGWAGGTEAAKLTASDGAADDEFGISVAVDGDTIVVGANKDDHNGDDSGSAYVFVKPDAGWADGTETAKFTAPDGAAGDRYGHSVGASGDNVLVGAPSFDSTDDSGGIGAAYLLRVSDWTGVTGVTDSETNTVAYNVTGLTNGEEYTFQIRGVNAAGGGLASANASATPQIPKPLGLSALNAEAGDTQVTVSWADKNDRLITAYQLLQLPETKLTVDDGAADDEFGASVAIDGDTAVVGAPGRDTKDADGNVTADAGAVYVFVRDGQGVWKRAGTLTASDGATDDEFGISVAVDGDTIVVGAPRHDIGGDGDKEGASYVFTKPANGWETTTETAKLIASDGAADDEFGISVAVSGNIVVVGARGDDASKGSAYVFLRPTSSKGWADWDDSVDQETAKLTHSSLEAGDEFGISVAVDGDIVVAGARGDDNGKGLVYVFAKPTSIKGWADTIAEPAQLTASDSADDDEFGISVDVDGNTIVVGAHQHDVVGDDNQEGAAYVFAKPKNGDWATSTETAKLTASDGAAGDEFGTSVAMDGATIVVGSWGEDEGYTGVAVTNAGGVYVFALESGVWREELDLLAYDGGPGDNFGRSVAVAGKTVLAGSPGDDSPTDSGSAYLIDLAEWADLDRGDMSVSEPDGGGRRTYSRRVTGLTNDQLYVYRVRAVNIGGNTPTGEIFHATPMSSKPGKPAGLTAAAGNRRVTLSWDDPRDSSLTGYQVLQPTEQTKLTAGSDDAANEEFGGSVAVDDGTAVVGAPEHDINGNANAGAAYVFTRAPDSGEWSRPIELTAGSDGAENDWFGYSVAVDGDTIVVGAYQNDADTNNNNEGSAYIFTKVDGEWSGPVKLIASDTAANDWFGYSVAVDDDTIVVGARWHNGKAGAAYVFTRDSGTGVWGDDPGVSGTQRIQTAKLTASDGGAFNYFGHSVAVHGETIVIGAPGYNDSTGVAYVFTRDSGTGVWGNDPEPGETHRVETAKLTAFNGHAGDGFGNSVAVDGNTAVVGAQQGDGERGSAYVFTEPTGDGGWADNTETAKLAASDRELGDHFGNSVAVRGGSIVVGAYTANINECDECDEDPRSGAAYLFTKPAGAVWANDPNEDHRTESGKLILPTDGVEEEDGFGNSVALDGQSIVVGAPQDDDEFGSVYVSDIRGGPFWQAEQRPRPPPWGA